MYPHWAPQLAPLPPPPATAPGGPAVKQPSAAKTANQDSSFEAKFNTLLNAVAKAGANVPTELQEVAQTLAMPLPLPEPQTLEEAYKAVSSSRKAVEQAKLARHQMHNTWRIFLGESAKKWDEFAQNFQKQEHALGQQIQNAKVTYKAATSQFEKMKAAHPGTELEVEVISDEDSMETKDKADASSVLQETLHNMQETFATLKTKADTLIEEQATKKQKLDGSSMPSMEPFGKPGV